MTDSWSPTWTVAPGEVLVEALAERGMSQAELSRRMARPLKTISEIATGKAAITPETAIQLERALGISALVWLGLEGQYREALARGRDLQELRQQVDWLRRFPVRELVERGLVRKGDAGVQVADLLTFFGVSSRTGWDQHWGQLAANYRLPTRGRIAPEAVATWLRLGERAAAGLSLAPYNRAAFRAVLPEVRSLSRTTVFAAATKAIEERLAAVGVAFVLVGGLDQAPASGSVRWVGDNPVIELTLRYRADDQFWFSLYHEAGHLIEGGRRAQVIEELPDGQNDAAEEGTANTFAREMLVPSNRLAPFVAAGDFSRSAVQAFAADLDIAPGIVVGRLQRDKHVTPSALNDLKRSLGS